MWEMLAFQAEISYNIYVKSVLAHLVSIVSFRSLVGVLYLNLKVQDSYQMYSDNIFQSLFIYRFAHMNVSPSLKRKEVSELN